jgi:raffinose/stachyose/melibiose transport system permease protein
VSENHPILGKELHYFTQWGSFLKFAAFCQNGDIEMTKKKSQNLSLILFVMPAFIVYAIFKLYPTFSGFYYSLTDWNGLTKSKEFVGMANFQEIFSDKSFWKSLLFTSKYVLVMLIIANILALSLAVAIESRGKAKGLFRTLFCMPNMISMIIGGYMWNFIFTKVLYYLSDNWGWTFFDKSWIGDPKYAFIAIVIVSTWGIVGYLLIIYMAALQGVPVHLMESASLDGAGSWIKFWKITFPLIRHSLTICIFWTLNSMFQVFDVIYSLTGGGPGRATQSVAINIYEEAFTGNNRFGYATAKSMVLFFVVFIITIIQIGAMKRKEQEL